MSDLSNADEVLREFLAESRENLDQLDLDLVTLERNPAARETLDSVFRTIHTIKGTCGFLGFARLEAVTHVAEGLIGRLRDGELRLTPEIANALLAMVDSVRAMLATIEMEQHDGHRDYSELIATLTALQRDDAPSDPAALAGTAAAAAADAPVTLGDATVRVNVAALDSLMNLAGELVLVRNQILRFNAERRDPAFVATCQRLDLITADLQDNVMRTRMQPIGSLFDKFPRVVRDLALTCGKRVALAIEGRETELDRSIVEAVRDPLTHLVRNAVDHGVERPDVRAARGKPVEGRLRLRAFHEGGQVNIEIADDGGGIDLARLKDVASQRGLATSEQLDAMSDRDLLRLMFLPGLSTAREVTSISGRGIGMDVVKNNVERIGGTIDVQSVVGAGTTFKIKIPLTLAIVPALVVVENGERYAIPQTHVVEVLRLSGEKTGRGIEMVHGVAVYRLRGTLLPLVRLRTALGLDDRAPARDERADVVVLRADDVQFGLVVDDIDDSEEIVVKPLTRQLRGLSAFLGATIMGDGRVALILDVWGLGERTGLLTTERDRAVLGEADVAPAPAEEGRAYVLVETADGGRMAVPLAAVARLEEVPLAAIERLGSSEVMQYRDEIIPIVRPERLLHGVTVVPEQQAPELHVVVCSEGTRRLGLVVEQVVDIVQLPASAEQPGGVRGCFASAVVRQRVTELLDVRELVALAPAIGRAAGDGAAHV